MLWTGPAWIKFQSQTALVLSQLGVGNYLRNHSKLLPFGKTESTQGVAVMGRREKYRVRLDQEDREQLQQLIRSGKSRARVMTRARILLKSDEGWKAPKVSEALDVSVGTVFRIKRRFAEEGMKGALLERPRPRPRRKLDDKGEAHLIALACSAAPEGHDHWTLRLLAGKVVELGLVPSMSHEGIRKRLKKTFLSRGRRRNGVFLR